MEKHGLLCSGEDWILQVEWHHMAVEEERVGEPFTTLPKLFPCCNALMFRELFSSEGVC